jgi:S-adenosylmethionine-diacylglycerol 3-amino-3-carboxypropyl transferase
VGAHYLERARVGLTEVPLWCNPYGTYMLSGRYAACAPDYLRSESLARVSRLTGNVEVSTATLQDTLAHLPDRSVDAFYLSDVFELHSEGEHEAALEEIARVGRPGARLCYWNNLVPRWRPARLSRLIESHDELAAALFARDRAFLYSRFVVESVRDRRSGRAA